jgi:hypothetical protein
LVVGNGSIEVGNKTAAREPGQPIIERLARIDGASEPRINGQNPLQNPRKAERPKICRVMSQQRGDSGRGNDSAPQKFVQLVGCCDPNARTEPWIRPRPVPVTR